MSGTTMQELTVTVRLSKDIIAKLSAVSERRGKTVDETISNLVLIGYDTFLDFTEQLRNSRDPVEELRSL